MQLNEATVTQNDKLQGDYRLLTLLVPNISGQVEPGQFVDLRVTEREDILLRRPFSVFQTDNDSITILYKVVGRGTQILAETETGKQLSVLGPLGRGFPHAGQVGKYPVLVAGGYGTAALYLTAQQSETKGVLLIGGASSEDILCVDDFENLGWEVRIATEDGSSGVRGLVTILLDELLATQNECRPELFACGPYGLLKAVAKRANEHDIPAWISMDHHMVCGTGVCLACVQKIRNAKSGWSWARVCKDGPVFASHEIIWDED